MGRERIQSARPLTVEEYKEHKLSEKRNAEQQQLRQQAELAAEAAAEKAREDAQAETPSENGSGATQTDAAGMVVSGGISGPEQAQLLADARAAALRAGGMVTAVNPRTQGFVSGLGVGIVIGGIAVMALRRGLEPIIEQTKEG